MNILTHLQCESLSTTISLLFSVLHTHKVHFLSLTITTNNPSHSFSLCYLHYTNTHSPTLSIRHTIFLSQCISSFFNFAHTLPLSHSTTSLFAPTFFSLQDTHAHTRTCTCTKSPIHFSLHLVASSAIGGATSPG